MLPHSKEAEREYTSGEGCLGAYFPADQLQASSDLAGASIMGAASFLCTRLLADEMVCLSARRDWCLIGTVMGRGEGVAALVFFLCTLALGEEDTLPKWREDTQQ